jgi:hypothetical protein
MYHEQAYDQVQSNLYKGASIVKWTKMVLRYTKTMATIASAL